MQWEKYIASNTQRKQKASLAVRDLGSEKICVDFSLQHFWRVFLSYSLATFLVTAQMLLPIQDQLLQCHHFHLLKVLCAAFPLSARWFLLPSESIRQNLGIVMGDSCASSSANTSRLLAMLAMSSTCFVCVIVDAAAVICGATHSKNNYHFFSALVVLSLNSGAFMPLALPSFLLMIFCE